MWNQINWQNNFTNKLDSFFKKAFTLVNGTFRKTIKDCARICKKFKLNWNRHFLE
jgi:hypothetical protein